MTVKELRDWLAALPDQHDDLPVLTWHYDDHDLNAVVYEKIEDPMLARRYEKGFVSAPAHLPYPPEMVIL